MASNPEKRKIPRRDFPHAVRYHLTREISGTFQFLEGASRGLDISSHGLGLTTEFPLRKGDVLKVLIPSLVEDAEIPVFSRVAWSREEKGGYRVGMEFLS
jgi:hypothetical protein